jgi:hypothetical protein
MKRLFLLFVALVCAASPTRGQAVSSPGTGKDKLDVISDKIDQLTKEVKAGSPFKDFVLPLLPTVISIVALIVTYKLTKGEWDESRRTVERTLQHQLRQSEAALIREKLDGFFGPLNQLRSTSTVLYQALKSAQPDPDNFRTLKAILEGFQFDPNSKMLIEEIIDIGKKTDELIAGKAGLIDEDIAGILGKFQAHYRVLRLAYEGTLKGEFERFRDYVFPREFDEAVRKKTSNLKARLVWLTSADNLG